MIYLDEVPRGAPKMTKENIQAICMEQKLFRTPSLNDILYLHYQGFTKIENLENYTSVRSLWLQCNGIRKIENLENQTDLRCLNLHSNSIDKIENLEMLPKLSNINLCKNMISKIENLSKLSSLEALDISDNYIKTIEDLEHLEQCKCLRQVDLAHNEIADPNVIEIFANMLSLKTLSLLGNPVVGKIRNYRRTMIVRCKNLTSLDERLILPVDRRAAEAWNVGGIDAERKVFDDHYEEKLNQRKEMVDGLMRNRLIIREKAQAKWKKRKSEKKKMNGLLEEVGEEDEYFYPDLLGSDESSLSLSGIEDLCNDYSSISSENENSDEYKNIEEVPPISSHIDTDSSEIVSKDLDNKENDHEKGIVCHVQALLKSDTWKETDICNHPEISNGYSKVNHNNKIRNNDNIETNSDGEKGSKDFYPEEYELYMNQFLGDESEMTDEASMENGYLNEDVLNNLFEKMFLKDEDEKPPSTNKVTSLSDTSEYSSIPFNDLGKVIKNQEFDDKYLNSSLLTQSSTLISEKEVEILDQNICKERVKKNISEETVVDESADNYRNKKKECNEYLDRYLNSLEQEENNDEELPKTNTAYQVSEIMANFRASYENENEINNSNEKRKKDAVDKNVIGGLEEYRIKQEENEVDTLYNPTLPL